MNINEYIAKKLSINQQQVNSTVRLLDDGASVPFIARYRKEATDGLNDTQLRELDELLNYLRELEKRKLTIIKSITEQKKLTSELEAKIHAADNKSALEDLYLPYKPKRRTRAQIAREAGLQPLAEKLLQDPSHEPDRLAQSFINPEKNIDNVKLALEGARQILMEKFSEEADLLATVRDYVWKRVVLTSQVAKGKEQEGKKFADYFSYQEAISKTPSHRALALFRGRAENILRLRLELSENDESHCQQLINDFFKVSDQLRPADQWLQETVKWAWQVKLFIKIQLDLMTKLRELAEEEAIKVFSKNLKDLLLTAPAGAKVTLGLDPGLRTGVKVIVVDRTGQLLAHTTIFPHPPKKDWKGSLSQLGMLCEQYQVELISIGNGTASRETDRLVTELMQQHKQLNLTKVVTSEAGASVYSASALAAAEFPDLDVSYRGAVSIARRLQDPLAEIVKIEPKSIGVGQYQHDVNQGKLNKTLLTVVEDCVNDVGVNVNMASVPLLSRVSGLNGVLAKNIVEYREQHGAFRERKELMNVPRMGTRTYEQAAGFLRIPDGDNPLDASGVHPESYPIVERILISMNKQIFEVMGNKVLLQALKPTEFTDEQFGMPTITDIIQELEKPGRDPRPEFIVPKFKDGIEKIEHLAEGMLLEGLVTNVANFGVFVDIGVHQDGLVHTSELANRFVKHPSEIVRVGDIVKVKVLNIDMQRRRIALSMRLHNGLKQGGKVQKSNPKQSQGLKKSKQANTALAQAFQDALRKDDS